MFVGLRPSDSLGYLIISFCWRDHCSPQFVQPSPSCLVPTKTKRSLQSLRASSIFLTRHPPSNPKPQHQWFPGSLKNCPRSNRCFVTARSATKQILAQRPTLLMIAPRTSISIWPAQLVKILAASVFCSKSPLKFVQSSWIIFHNWENYMLWLLQSKRYPRRGMRHKSRFSVFLSHFCV